MKFSYFLTFLFTGLLFSSACLVQTADAASSKVSKTKVVKIKNEKAKKLLATRKKQEKKKEVKKKISFQEIATRRGRYFPPAVTHITSTPTTTDSSNESIEEDNSQIETCQNGTVVDQISAPGYSAILLRAEVFEPCYPGGPSDCATPRNMDEVTAEAGGIATERCGQYSRNELDTAFQNAQKECQKKGCNRAVFSGLYCAQPTFQGLTPFAVFDIRPHPYFPGTIGLKGAIFSAPYGLKAFCTSQF